MSMYSVFLPQPILLLSLPNKMKWQKMSLLGINRRHVKEVEDLINKTISRERHYPGLWTQQLSPFGHKLSKMFSIPTCFSAATLNQGEFEEYEERNEYGNPFCVSTLCWL